MMKRLCKEARYVRIEISSINLSSIKKSDVAGRWNRGLGFSAYCERTGVRRRPHGR
jgi:hypothetical protein